MYTLKRIFFNTHPEENKAVLYSYKKGNYRKGRATPFSEVHGQRTRGKRHISKLELDLNQKNLG